MAAYANPVMPPPVIGGVAVGTKSVGTAVGYTPDVGWIVGAVVGEYVGTEVGMRVGDPVAVPNTCSPLLIMENERRRVNAKPFLSTVETENK